MLTEQFVLCIGVGRNKGDLLCSLRVYDFTSFLGGERNDFDYKCFYKCRDLSADPVDLWQVVPAHFDGVSGLLMLVDEEGLLHDPQDPFNPVASVSANIGYPICGDVFIVRDKGDDMQFLSMSDLKAIFSNFELEVPKPISVH